MGNIEKQLRRIGTADRERVFQAIERLAKRDLQGLHCKKLKGYECIYRIRVGNYRIIYFDDGKQILLKAIKRRNESTYRVV